MGPTPVPEDHYYRLPQLATEKSFATPRFNGAISVSQLEFQDIPDSRSILYVNPDHPNEINVYYYRHWVEAPTKLVKSSLIDYLRSTGIANQVESLDGHDPSSIYLISGKLSRFERVLTDNNPVINVALEMSFATGDPSHTSFQKLYQAEIAASDFTMDATIDAFGHALEKVYQNFINDLSKN